MCVLREKSLQKISQPCVQIERRMQCTKAVLSRGFECLFGPFVGNHWVALTRSAHSGHGADRCSINCIETIKEMGRMVFNTLANASMVHAEKTTAPERDLESFSRHFAIVLLPQGWTSLVSQATFKHPLESWRRSLFFQENTLPSFLLCTLGLVLLLRTLDLRPNTTASYLPVPLVTLQYSLLPKMDYGRYTGGVLAVCHVFPTATTNYVTNTIHKL